MAYQVHEMKDFTGTDFTTNPARIGPQVLSNSQNAWKPRDGLMGKRPGTKTYASLPSGFVRVAGLTRWYQSDGTAQTIVAMEGSSTVTFYKIADTGTVTTLSGGTSYGTGNVTFDTYKNNLYMSNGTQPVKKWTGTGSLSDVAAWTTARRGTYLKTYRDRLWGAGGTTNPDTAWFTDTFSAESFTSGTQVVYFGDKDGDVCTGIGLIGTQTDATGIRGQIVFFKNRSTWVWDGDPVANGRLEKISSKIGCASGRTIAQTPLGIVFMGHDNVYLMSTVSEPLAVGWPIKSVIDAIPAAQRANAAAIYHNGHYKLSLTSAGGTKNTKQYWLDLRAYPNSIGWFGPMVNGTLHSFGAMDVCLGTDRPSSSLSTDSSEQAIAVSDQNGKIIWLDQNTWDDSGTAITQDVTTHLFAADSPYLEKFFRKYGINVLADGGQNFTGEVSVDDGASVFSENVIVAASGASWDTSQWDVGVWGGTFYHQMSRPLASARRGTKASVRITHANAADFRFESLQLAYEPSKRIMESR